MKLNRTFIILGILQVVGGILLVLFPDVMYVPYAAVSIASGIFLTGSALAGKRRNRERNIDGQK